jgi:transposase
MERRKVGWPEKTRAEVLAAHLEGQSIRSLAREFKVPRATVHRWVSDAEAIGAPRPARQIGRPRLLSESEEKALLGHLAKNPYLSNEELASKLGNKIAPRTVSHYLKRQPVPYTQHEPRDDITGLDDARVVRESRLYLRSLPSIPWANRVYEDESFIYDNDMEHRGRAPQGTRIHRPRRWRGKRFSFAIVLSQDGLLNVPELQKENFDTARFELFVQHSVAPVVTSGTTVFWDRLGRSGRAVHPTAQHYSPQAIASVEAQGGKVCMLPPLGKLFNPCELAVGFLKERVRRYYHSSRAFKEGRPRTFVELGSDLKRATEGITPQKVRGWWRERADGRAFEEALEALRK